jgi:serine/threonine protein kinase
MDPLEPGDPRQIGAYRLVGRLGGGGMGQVFLGASPGGRPVAVKVVHRQFAADPEFRQRFAREVDAARRVGGFHTAPVVDADPDAESPWMVTAYIAGPSLGSVVVSGGPLPVPEASALGAALAEGLAAIHACGLVHRDLKPANIIMADDGPRIIDFGIARSAQPDGATGLTTPGTLIGTYAFMSPEQVRAETATQATDVFALGCVLGYAATGRAPFEGDSVPAIMYRLLEGTPDLGNLPPGPFRDAVEGCLAKDPAQRPALPDLIAQFALEPPTVLVPGGRDGPSPGGRGADERSDRDGGHVAVIPEGTPGIAPAERHENITITQQANAGPGSIVIQVAGNAKLGDDA